MKETLLNNDELKVLKDQSKERREIERKFIELHRTDSDEELLNIVRKKADELGKLPRKQDVIGFACIKERFGPWPRVLEAAGLKAPKESSKGEKK